MKLSLSDAARAAGIARSTLYRHIGKGRISLTIEPTGKRRIDTSELIRCYGDAVRIPATPATSRRVALERTGTYDGTSTKDTTEAELAQIRRLEVENELLRRRVTELESDKDRLFALVERQTLLLIGPGSRDEAGKQRKKRKKNKGKRRKKRKK